MKFRQAALAALGLATLTSGWIFVPLLDPKHIELYHWFLSSTLFYLPCLVDFALVWALWTMLIRTTLNRRTWSIIFWAATLSVTPRILMKSLGLAGYVHYPHWLGVVIAGFGGLCFLVVVYLGLRSEIDIDRSVRIVSNGYMLLGASGALYLLQICWYWGAAAGLNHPRPSLIADRGAGAGTPRIIWVLFDELSYQQVFERRFPDVKLPAFDHLAQGSSVFTAVVPTADATQKAVPSLLLGKPVNDIRSTASGSLQLQSQTGDPWESFDPKNTVFRDALNHGYRNRIVGWFNPYCRILGSVLDGCSSQWESDKASFAHAFAMRMFAPWLAAAYLEPIRPLVDAHWNTSPRERHVIDLNAIMPRAEAALLDPADTMTFIHLPVPHPPGIYNRREHTVSTVQGSYLDNLELADACLARLVETLQKAGQWDSSVFVIMGDHSWRTQTVWRDSLWWTPEETLASGGRQYDPRPAYLVKLPGQTNENRIDAKFDAIRTRAMLDAIMDGHIRTSQDLTAWASAKVQ